LHGKYCELNRQMGEAEEGRGKRQCENKNAILNTGGQAS